MTRTVRRVLVATAFLAACSNPGAAPDARSGGILVVVEENGARLTTLDAQSGAVLHRVGLDSLPHEVEIGPDGRTAYVSNFGLRDYDLRIGEPGHSIAIVDLQDGTLTGHLWLGGDSLKTTGARAPHGVKLRPPARRELYTNAELGDSMIVFDVSTRARIRTFPVPAGTHNFVFSADGKALWLMAGDSGVYRMDPDSGTVTGHVATSTPIRGLGWTPDGHRLLASGRGQLLIINPYAVTVDRTMDSLGVGQIIYSAGTLDGSYLLAPAPFDSMVVVVNRLTGKVEHRLHTGVSPIRVIPDPTGSRAYVANAEDDHVSVIDLDDWSVHRLGALDEPNGLALLTDAGDVLTQRDSVMLDSLGTKPWQQWNAGDLRWGLGHEDAWGGTHLIPNATRVHPLPVGPAIADLAPGTPAGDSMAQYLTDQDVTGLLVLQDGRIRMEWYAPGRPPQQRWTSQSVAKSFTSTLVAAAIHDGYIHSLDDTVSRYITALKGSAYDDVSIRQLLTMSSGVRWDESYTDLGSDLARLYATAPAPGMSMTTTYMRTLPREFPPGERWVYKTGETHLIGDLVRAATGRSLSGYLAEKIWKPYGMEAQATWAVDPSGAEFAGCCLQMTLRDYGRFGQLVLDNGRIGDLTIVDADWFANATASHFADVSPGNGYGYQWWTHADGTFSAFGIYGQMIDIDPARKLVVVMNSAWPDAISPERSKARRTFTDMVKAALDAEGGG